MQEMDKHKRLFSKRKIVILASILLVAIITTGLLLAAFHPKGIGVVHILALSCHLGNRLGRSAYYVLPIIKPF